MVVRICSLKGGRPLIRSEILRPYKIFGFRGATVGHLSSCFALVLLMPCMYQSGTSNTLKTERVNPLADSAKDRYGVVGLWWSLTLTCVLLAYVRYSEEHPAPFPPCCPKCHSTSTDVVRSVVWVSVCLCIGHTGELCKNGWTDRDAVWLADLCMSKEPRIRRSLRSDESIRRREGWQEGDAAFYQITLDICSTWLGNCHYIEQR